MDLVDGDERAQFAESVREKLVLSPGDFLFVSARHGTGFYGVEVTRARALELVATLGAGFTLREGARQLVKLVPGYGSAVSAGVAFAGTVALGEAARAWFRGKMQAPPEELRETFRQAAERAKEEFAGGHTIRHAAEVAALRKRLEAGEITQEEFQRAIARLGEAA